MEIIKHTNALIGENTYFIINDQALLVVDPGSDIDELTQIINDINKPIAAILLTHTHYDHIIGVDPLRQAFNHPPVYVSEKEADWLGSPVDNLSGLDRHSDMANVTAKPAEHFFQYDEDYTLSGFNFRVVQTPGHSIGGVSFIFDKEAFVVTGDALFKESVGRWDLPTGNYEQLLEGIHQHLFSLPDHFTIYPGHRDHSTIGHEKAYNPHFN